MGFGSIRKGFVGGLDLYLAQVPKDFGDLLDRLPLDPDRCVLRNDRGKAIEKMRKLSKVNNFRAGFPIYNFPGEPRELVDVVVNLGHLQLL